MQNLKQMTDRDDMSCYLEKFTKTELLEMLASLGYIKIKSLTKRDLTKLVVDHYMFQVLNKMMANRPTTHPYFR